MDCRKIASVQKDSIAEEAGIEQGDILISVNGEQIKDVFDYRMLIANEFLVLEIQKPDGDIWEVEIEKEEYEDIGLEFYDAMMDESKSCRNKCIFCFIDQLPEGMRDTLYFKDDDSRLSFLNGNYVTLTNMDETDIMRIIKYRMSPINVSVHTTNPDLRVYMLGNRFAGDIIKKIAMLVEGGIIVNSQIVLCRGINDRDELERSVRELASFYPSMASISVVPVGITRYRDKLTELLPYDKEAAIYVIRQINKLQQEFLTKYGSRIVYAADEFYIMAEEQLPEHEEYEDYPQIENGVGLITILRYEFDKYLNEIKYKLDNNITVSIATGVSAYKYIKEMTDILQDRFTGLKINVYPIKNLFFGEYVTVAGLLTGQDISSQLKGKELGDALLLSKSMLREGEDTFLDNYTVEMLENDLNIRIITVDNTGKDFIKKILMGNGGGKIG